LQFPSAPEARPSFACDQVSLRKRRVVDAATEATRQPKGDLRAKPDWFDRRAMSGAIRSLLMGVASVVIFAPPLSADVMSAAAFRALAETCAPGVAPDLLSKLVSTESGFNAFAIGVNGVDPDSYAPRTAVEATTLARQLITEGRSIDMGLGQINSANLAWLGLTPDSVFDPCANLAATETVLRDGYERARQTGASPGDALGQALSAYNTGSPTRGFANGYVARVLERDVGSLSRRIQTTRADLSESASTDWDVFGSSDAPIASVFQ